MNLSTSPESQTANSSEVEVTPASNNNVSDKSDLVQKIKTNLFRQERNRLKKLTSQIRHVSSSDDFLAEVVAIVQEALKVDRAFIYRFDSQDKGLVLAESLIFGWTPSQDEVVPCVCFGAPKAEDYLKQEYIGFSNVKESKVSPYQKQLLEKYQVQASLTIPILVNSNSSAEDAYSLDKVWGLLVIQQCERPRQWEEEEINLVTQLSTELTVRLQQTAFVEQSNFQSQQGQTIAQIVRRIQQSQDIKDIFRTATSEVRQLVNCDRVVVYQFKEDWSGEVLAESMTYGWTSVMQLQETDEELYSTEMNANSSCTLKKMEASSALDTDTWFKDSKGGDYTRGRKFNVVNDVYAAGFSSCYLRSLEKYQAKAYIIVPIFQEDKLWGLFAAYQNSNAREWQSNELSLMLKIAPQLGIAIEQAEKTSRLEKTLSRQKSIAKMVDRLGDALALEDVLEIAAQETRNLLAADRTSIYRFDSNWGGQNIVEAPLDEDFKSFQAACFKPLVAKDAFPFLQKDKAAMYQNGNPYIVKDVFESALDEKLIKVLEQLKIRAYVRVPIFVEQKLWGIMNVSQSEVRDWQEEDIKFLQQVIKQVSIAIQQKQYLESLKNQASQEKVVSNVINKIVGSLKIQDVFRYATQEVREILDADRVVVYQFKEDWSGEVLAESMTPGWVSVIELQESDETLYNTEMNAYSSCTLKELKPGGSLDNDTYFKKNKGGDYTRGKQFNVVNDVYAAGFSDCYLRSLEKYQAKAYIIVPIFQEDKLWGLFAAYQNAGAREWQPNELNLMLRLASPLGVAIQQAEFVQQIEAQSKQNEVISSINDRIRNSSKIENIFRNSVQEVRKALSCDRCVVYRFNPDWSGQVVSESVGSDWVSVMEIQEIDDSLFSTDMNNNERCTLVDFESGGALDRDTYFLESGGGNYSKGKKFNVVNDIYDAGFSDCYLRSLEKYQAKAYMIVPIFQGNKLWGLFAVYQNSEMRTWQTSDLNLLLKIAPQLGIAIEQAEKSEQLKTNSDNLEKTLAREKAAREELQKQALDILKTVRPAFSGDLTVRANVTETEIGTVAGAYNTTLDSLKDIVIQVKDTVEKVASTTGTSSIAMEGLSLKSQQQLQELESALEQIRNTIEASTVTTKNVEKVETAIQQADSVVQSGDRAMNKTVESILSIRETVSSAGKRVKRLSDSSQKISRVVNLISSFAAQTNLLALNAALEATRAGEYGKGFAVVADEVRNLSLQSSEATTEIEKLVREIQEETQEVAAAMEAGVQQVAEGTSLVNETRESLTEIVSSTEEIRELVSYISLAASAQTKQAESVTKVVGQVAEIANETSADSNRISGSFQELEQLAKNLQSSVSRFKVK